MWLNIFASLQSPITKRQISRMDFEHSKSLRCIFTILHYPYMGNALVIYVYLNRTKGGRCHSLIQYTKSSQPSTILENVKKM